MFGNILGKSKEESSGDKEHDEIVQKVSKMNISDMRVYINNKLTDFEISEDGLSEVMRKLLSKDAKEKRFIESDAMDSKIKKAFDLVIIVSASKKITVVTTELIQDFITQYSDLIEKYDTDNKQIYGSKLNDALAKSISSITEMAELKRKMGVLGE